MQKKWNLQDIRPSNVQREQTQPRPPERLHQDIGVRRPTQPPPEIDPDLSTIDIIDGKTSRLKRTVISIVVTILIIGVGYGATTMLTGARVTVHPKFKDVSVQATFTTYKQPLAGNLAYELLTLEATSEKQVASTGQEKVSVRAQGNIFIYNAKSIAPQRLIKNTRFESPDGLIFRITESVEVPGATKDASGALTPGVITAVVIADGTGDQYNLKPGRFTIPGLKGSPQFDSVYGESNVAFTGGFEGNKYIIDENELNTAKQALDLELRNALLTRLKNERPAGFVVYDKAVTFAFDSLPATSQGDKIAIIKEHARLQVPMFKSTDFAEYIAKNTVPGYENDPVTLTDPLSLQFDYTSATTTTFDIAPLTQLEFTLKGTSRLVWVFDQDKLKNELLGKEKTALPNIFTSYSAISKADAVILPFWSQTFPHDPKEITVTTIIDDKPAN